MVRDSTSSRWRRRQRGAAALTAPNARVLLVAVVLAASFAMIAAEVGAAEATGSSVRVPRWQPHDFAFACAATPNNPFQTPFSCEATGPGGERLTTPGFYDGAGMWKVRFAPPTEGRWTLVTRSSLPELDRRSVALTCVDAPSGSHGPVGIDPQYPRHFVYADGTRFFPMGYECDWLWALDLGLSEPKALPRFLDKISATGFNYVILNAYAHDTTWRRGKSGDDDFGPPPLFAWEGTNEKPDHSRFRPAYWQHYDRVIDALYRRGMIAHLMIKVYNKLVRWPAKGGIDDDLYFRWLIARYAAYPNVHWDFSKEANNEPDVAYKLDRLRFLRHNDPYRRLVTVHDDHRTYDRGTYGELVDYRSDQQHSDWRAVLLEHRRQRVWPIVNVEFGYERGVKGIGDRTYPVVQSPEEVCRRAWEVCLAGGYPVYYYTYTAWDVIRPEDTPPGYAYFRHLRDFFEQTAYWRLEPSAAAVSRGWCLADPGREYVAFLNRAQPFTLELKGLSRPLEASWFHPWTGRRQPAGKLENGLARLDPPVAWGNAPVALHVGAVPADRRRDKNSKTNNKNPQ